MTVNVERKEKKKQQNKTKQNNDEKIEWRQKRELGWTERIIFVIIVVAFVAQKGEKCGRKKSYNHSQNPSTP